MTLSIPSIAVRRQFIMLMAVATGWVCTTPLDAASAYFYDAEDSGSKADAHLVETEEGTARLQWRAAGEEQDDEASFVLQYARGRETTNWVTRYEGPDTATVVSGLPEGDHYYRVRVMGRDADTEDWSQVMTVRVVYPGKPLVIGLMTLGTVVFVATLMAIWRGHVRHRSPLPQPEAAS